MKHAFTWSIEIGDRCPACRGAVVLIRPSCFWETVNGDDSEEIEITEEVSGHYCPTCDRMTSLSLNIMERQP